MAAFEKPREDSSGSCGLPEISYQDALSVLAKRGLLLGQSALSSAPISLFSHTLPRKLTASSLTLNIGDIFIAYRGVKTDSHSFLKQACEKRAGFLIVEKSPPEEEVGSTPWLLVSSGRAAWAWLSAAACGNPQDGMRFYGVTGTNGKTSSVWMLRGLLEASGISTMSCGTLGIYWKDNVYPTGHTSPDPSIFYPLLAKARKEGCDTVVMEVSSHALAQEKFCPIRFSGAAFTSFSRDHLDFHSDMAEYWNCKWRLFSDLLKNDGLAVFHESLADYLKNAGMFDQLTRLSNFSQISPSDVWVYGARGLGSAEESCQNSTLTLEGLSPLTNGSAITFRSNSKRQVNEGSTTIYDGRIPYAGSYNCENFLNAWLLASHRLGAPIPPKLWGTLSQVPGRLEQVITLPHENGAKNPKVYVDYAHTPDALQKALSALRPLCEGKLLVVFGCGGDRDRGKRPLMAKVAEAFADECYLTTDNPRHENPADILDEIKTGFSRSALESQVFVDHDRENSIAKAIDAAKEEDFVLIAGKGHENYQIFGSEKQSFDDRVVAAKYLRSRDRSSPCIAH